MANRKSAAKQARLDERAAQILAQAEGERRTRNIIIASFAVLILGGGGLIYYLANPPQPKTNPNAAVTASYAVPDECPVTNGKVNCTHVTEGSPITYKHSPPSSGVHYPTPKPWGPSKDPIASGYWVHNLEHGGIVLLYKKCDGTECDDLFTRVTDIYNNLTPKTYTNGTAAPITEVKLISSPFSDPMPQKFALLAWDREQDLKTLDQQAVIDFFTQYVDHGREDIP